MLRVLVAGQVIVVGSSTTINVMALRRRGPWDDEGEETTRRASPWANDEVSSPPRTRRATSTREEMATPQAPRKRGSVVPANSPWASELNTPTGKRPKRRALATVNMSEVLISAAAKAPTEDQKTSKHQLMGADPKQVRARLQGEGRCTCSTGTIPCHKDLPLRDLQSFCTAWHSMSDEEKWLMTHTMYQSVVKENGQAQQKRVGKVAWSLHGTRLCFPNFCHLIHVGPMTIRGYINEKQSATVAAPRGRRPGDRPQAELVDFFFMELYNSAAEALAKPARGDRRPEAQHRPTDQGPESDIHLHDSPWLDAGDPLNPGEDDSWEPTRPSVDQTHMLTQAARGLPVVGLRERYIQHTTVGILYWEFLAAWDTLKEHARKPKPKQETKAPTDDQETSLPSPPGIGVFRERWSEVWSKYIGIRQKTEHAQCNTCFRLMQIIAETSQTMQARKDAARALRQHHHDQYLDRTIYWNLRLASQMMGDILVLIIDAMDKAKFCWPAWPFDRRPKELEKLFRHSS